MSSLMKEVGDESHYNIRHKNNRIYVRIRPVGLRYYRNPDTVRPPFVHIEFRLDHHFVPDDSNLLRYSMRYIGGFKLLAAKDHLFRHPMSIFYSDFDDHQPAKRAFEAMFKKFQVPFEYQPEFGELHWGKGYGDDPIQGYDDMVNRIFESGASRIRKMVEKHGIHMMKGLKIGVTVLKKTVMDPEWFEHIDALSRSDRGLGPLDDDDDGFESDKSDDLGSEWFRGMEAVDELERGHDSESDCDDYFNHDHEQNRPVVYKFSRKEAGEFVQTVACDGCDDGDDLECSICTEEIETGKEKYMGQLVCSHKFHKKCIVKWFRDKQTCPLCRFESVQIVD